MARSEYSEIGRIVQRMTWMNGLVGKYNELRG